MLSVDLPEGQLADHTFHYSTADTPLQPVARAAERGGRSDEGVYRLAHLTATYMHFYFPANPQAAVQLLLSSPASPDSSHRS